MKSHLFLFLFSATAASLAQAAAPPSTDDPLSDFLGKLETRVKVRQSVADSSLIEKPAKFQWVRSDDGNEDTSSIDVGLTFLNVPETAYFRIAPFAEYHRQTLTTKRQDNFQAGVAFDNAMGDVSLGLAALNQLALSYKEDRWSTGEAFLARLTTIPVNPHTVPGWGSEGLAGSTVYVWLPTLGIQYESAENVRKSQKGGQTYRAYGSVELAFYPNGKILKNRFEVVVRASAWRNFSASRAFALLYERDQTLFAASLSYYLDPKKRVGLGVDYVNGQNPEQGLQKQKSTTLSLKLKI
jgi:hypothetical protein